MAVGMLQVDVGDLTFDVRTDGPDDGLPVLLLHGFPETSLSWTAVTPLLAQAGVPAEAVDAYVAQLSAPGALTAALNWYRAMSSGTHVDPVDVPTTYVWSDGDVAVGRTAAEACADHVRGDYRFLHLPGVTHWIPEQAPEQLAAA